MNIDQSDSMKLKARVKSSKNYLKTILANNQNENEPKKTQKTHRILQSRRGSIDYVAVPFGNLIAKTLFAL